ncbi:MAG: hypothetical protein ACR5K5_04405 [Wolbachia sp.]
MLALRRYDGLSRVSFQCSFFLSSQCVTLGSSLYYLVVFWIPVSATCMTSS